MTICRIPNFGPHVPLDKPTLTISALRAHRCQKVTHIYAGKAQHSMLKNIIDKEASRSPRPKTVGPRVPAEKLEIFSSEPADGYARHTKGY